MNYRTKSVSCVLCKTAKTRNVSAVCEHCTRLYNEAERIIRDANVSLSTGEKVLAFIDLDISAYVFYAEKSSKNQDAADIARKIGNLFLDFAQIGQIERIGTDWDRAVTLHSDKKFTVTLDSRKARISGNYLMTEEQVTIIKEVYQLLANMNSAAFEKGKREGASILRSLANNELSVNDLNSKL